MLSFYRHMGVVRGCCFWSFWSLSLIRPCPIFFFNLIFIVILVIPLSFVTNLCPKSRLFLHIYFSK